MTNNFKLIYPIISDYKYDLSRVTLDKHSSKTSAFTTGENDNLVNINSACTVYNVLYNYDKIGTKQFFLLTHFLKISKKPKISNNLSNGKEHEILFEFDTLNENPDNANFRNTILQIIDKVRTNIVKLHPEAIETPSKLPYCDGDNNNKLVNIHLSSFYDVTNKQYISITPIHFHQSKSKGGNVLIIKNNTFDETLGQIMTTMPMFKYSKYGKPPETDDGKLLYYDGRCSLSFFVIVRETKKCGFGQEMEKHIYYTIKICARELEIKHNVSYVKSVFDSDLSYINVEKQIDTLSI